VDQKPNYWFHNPRAKILFSESLITIRNQEKS
jgi:hypothetical protein